MSAQITHDRTLRSQPAVTEPAIALDIADLLLGAYRLTAREHEVAGLALLGKSTRQIGSALCIAPYTVQDHLKAIFQKVGVHSRRELMARVFFEQVLPRVTEHRDADANAILL